MKTFHLGSCYFTLSYFDEQLKMPLIETYIFIGVDLLPGEKEAAERTWYFKRPDSFLATQYQLTGAELQECVRFGEDTIELVLELPDLIHKLQTKLG